jgi:hypothetical protein
MVYREWQQAREAVVREIDRERLFRVESDGLRF